MLARVGKEIHIIFYPYVRFSIISINPISKGLGNKYFIHNNNNNNTEIGNKKDYISCCN